MYQCARCSGRFCCENINKKISALGSKKKINFKNSKKLASITDHLKRSGYHYPRVELDEYCWLSDRPVVADFYLREVEKLTGT